MEKMLVLLVNISDDGVLLYDNPERGWEIPGGMMEDGESPEDAVRRECMEELGWCPSGLVPGPILMLDRMPTKVFVSGEGPPEALSGNVHDMPPEDLAFDPQEFDDIVGISRRFLEGGR